MKKKLLIALPVCAVFIVAVCALFIIKWQGGVTLVQSMVMKNYLCENIMREQETGENLREVYVVSAIENDAAQTDSFLWFRNRYESSATHVELNVAFDSTGEVYLADSFEGVKEDSVKFERVVRHVISQEDNYTGFLLNLCEYTNLAKLAADIEAIGLNNRTVITGADENSVALVKKYFGRTPVLCKYNSSTKSNLAQLKERGADGVVCSYKDFSVSLIKKAKELDMQVWVDCQDNAYFTVKAIYHGADGVISKNPDIVMHCINNWGYESVYYDLKNSF